MNMEKKIAATVNSPLLYISQPVFGEVKPKMQEMCIVRPKTHVIEKQPVVSEVESNDREKKTSIESMLDENPKQIEEKLTPIENNIEEKLAPIENKIEEKIAPIEIKMDEKPNENKLAFFDKPMHFGNKIEKPLQAEEPIGKSPIKVENNIAPKVLSNHDLNDDLAKVEEKKAKRKKIVAYGIKSSFEKGIKASNKRKEIKHKSINPLALLAANSNLKKVKETNDSTAMASDTIENERQETNQNQEYIQKHEKQEPSLQNTNMQQAEVVEGKATVTKRFKELSMEEKVEYLLHLPPGVPKIKCEFETKEEKYHGIVIGYADGIVHIFQKKKPNKLSLKIEDIISINRKSF